MAAFSGGPPPIQDPMNNQRWLEWFRLISVRLNDLNVLNWDEIDFTASTIADIAVKDHNLLENFQGGTTNDYWHLTGAQHTEVTGFFGATDITGAEAETLTDGSNADALHTHTTGSLGLNITDNSDANWLTVDIDENATFAADVIATGYLQGSYLRAAGNVASTGTIRLPWNGSMYWRDGPNTTDTWYVHADDSAINFKYNPTGKGLTINTSALATFDGDVTLSSGFLLANNGANVVAGRYQSTTTGAKVAFMDATTSAATTVTAGAVGNYLHTDAQRHIINISGTPSVTWYAASVGLGGEYGSGVDYSILMGDDDNTLTISSSSGELFGGNIELTGISHATAAGDVKIRSDSNNLFYYDNSATTLYIGPESTAITIDSALATTFAGNVSITKSDTSNFSVSTSSALHKSTVKLWNGVGGMQFVAHETGNTFRIFELNSAGNYVADALRYNYGFGWDTLGKPFNCGLFSSNGIDDNATTTALTLDNSQNATFSGDIVIDNNTPALMFINTGGTAGYNETWYVQAGDIFTVQHRDGAGAYLATAYNCEYLTTGGGGVDVHRFYTGVNIEALRITQTGVTVNAGKSGTGYLYVDSASGSNSRIGYNENGSTLWTAGHNTTGNYWDIYNNTTGSTPFYITDTTNRIVTSGAVDDDLNQTFYSRQHTYAPTDASPAVSGANRSHTAVFIDVNADYDWSSTANGERVHLRGIHSDVRNTGGTYTLSGAYLQARSNNSTGAINGTYGFQAYAQAYSTGTGTNPHAYGGWMQADAGSVGNITNLIGMRAISNISASQASSTTISNMIGVEAEVQIANTSSTGITINNAYAVKALFDENDTTNTPSITTGFLFHGEYQGDAPTNPWGIYLIKSTKNLITGATKLGFNTTSAPATDIALQVQGHANSNNTDACRVRLDDYVGNDIAQITAYRGTSANEGELHFYVNQSGTLTKTLEIEQDGTLNVAATTNYEDLVTHDDDIPNKKYVDDAAGGGPAFNVSLSSDQTLNGASQTKVQWDTENFDITGDFDSTTNYRFTPSVAGRYIFTFCLTATATSGMTHTFCYIRKNGVEEAIGGASQYTTWASPTCSVVLDMNGTTDYVEAYAWTASGVSGGKIDAGESYFSGGKIA